MNDDKSIESTGSTTIQPTFCIENFLNEFGNPLDYNLIHQGVFCLRQCRSLWHRWQSVDNTLHYYKTINQAKALTGIRLQCEYSYTRGENKGKRCFEVEVDGSNIVCGKCIKHPKTVPSMVSTLPAAQEFTLQNVIDAQSKQRDIANQIEEIKQKFYLLTKEWAFRHDRFHLCRGEAQDQFTEQIYRYVELLQGSVWKSPPTITNPISSTLTSSTNLTFTTSTASFADMLIS